MCVCVLWCFSSWDRAFAWAVASARGRVGATCEEIDAAHEAMDAAAVFRFV